MKAMHAITTLVLALVVALVGPPASMGAEAASSLVLQSVDLAGYPTVRVGVTLPSGLVSAGETPVFEVLENGVKVSDVQAEALAATRVPVDVVLLIDASGSMAGVPIADARTAAKRFIATMAEGDRVAVLTFGEQVATVSPFSSDRVALGTAVDSIAVRGETALYDGVLKAVSTVGAADGRDRYIVVLSDGGDTVSVASLDDAVGAATAAQVPVYAVTLESPEYDPAPLRTIAQRSGGKALAVTETAALEGLFEGIALEFSNRYTITYTSAKPSTAEIDVLLNASGSGGEASVDTVLTNPVLAEVDIGEPSAGLTARTVDSVSSWLTYSGSVVLVFLAVALLAFGVMAMIMPRGNVMDQLRYYEQLHGSASPDEVAAAGRADAEVRGRLVEAVDFVAGKGGFKAALREQLERAGLPLRPTEYMYFHVLGVILLGVAAQLGFGNLLITVAMILIAVFVPIALLEARVARRCRAFETQLPDILGLIAGSLRAGWGVQQSLDLVVQEAGEPASSEFRRAQSEVRLGLPLEDALGRMAERVDSDDFRWTVSAIAIQREVGGNLAEVLDIVAGTIRERADLRREVHALTAEGRLSAVVLSILPFFMFAAMLILNPGYMARMFQAPIGIVALAFGLVLLVIGIIWTRSATRIEV